MASCKKQVTISKVAYVIGDNNMEIINERDGYYNQYKQIIDSSVVIVTNTPDGTAQYCSGVLVNGKTSLRILTNHHCFAVKGSDGLATPQLISTACEETNVYFNVIEGSLGQITSASCVSGSLITDSRADIASFALNGTIPSNARPIPLYNSTETAGRRALIIHHPVRDNNMRSIPSLGLRLPVSTITEQDCQVIGKFPKSEWAKLPVLSVSHRHTCDLVKGSSGSPLIDYETKSLIGVNWGGVKVQVGNNLRVDNAATTSEYVREFLSYSGSPNYISGDIDVLVEQSKQQASAEQSKTACGNIGVNHSFSFSILAFLLLPFGLSFYISRIKV